MVSDAEGENPPHHPYLYFVIDQDFVPQTIEEAANYLYGCIPLSEVDALRKQQTTKVVIQHPDGTKEEYETNPLSAVHFDFGRYIRNTWSLWQDTPLRRHAMETYRIKHGDDLWGMISEWVWALIQHKKFDTEAYSKRIAAHWARAGLNSYGEPV